MKKIYREFQKIYYNLDKILLLFFTLFAFMEFVWIPLNSWVSERLLALTGHAYLSPTNLLSVFSENLFVSGLFILLFFANIGIAYLELALLFTGVWQLLDEKVKHLSDYLRDVRDSMVAIICHSSLPKIIFLLFYSVLLLPFLRRILNIYYFNKIVVPQFVLDYLSNTVWIGVLILVSLLLFFWLASRLMFALPKIYFEHRSVKESIAFSWKYTKRIKQVNYLVRLVGLVTFPVIFFTGVALLLYSIQLFIEGYAPSLSYWLAVVCYIVLRLTYYGVIALFMIGFISLLTGKKLPIYCRKRLRHRLRLAILNGNAVQNSIEALEKTSQLKPDYIEMDVQETKDGQFIVMHDTDLMALTGNTGGTHDYTLAELTAMTASENGMTGPVPSFHEYLEKADELGQKLLVEIKVTDADSPNLTRNFLKKYGQRLIAKGHQMHSLDYRTIIESKQYNEQLVSFFILPFNSIYPTTVADGYTIEYTSLDQNFMTKSWIRGKSVYAWTPNDKESMTKMLLVQVDGIITDNLTGLKSLMSELKENHRYPDLFFLEFQHLFYNFE